MKGLSVPGVIYFQGRGESGVETSVSLSVLPSGDWTVVDVEGEMDVEIIPRLAELVASRTTRLVLDLREVTFMDTSALGMMVETHSKLVEAGGCVRLVAPSRSVRRVLALTGCDRVFRTFDTLEQALTTPLVSSLEPAL